MTASTERLSRIPLFAELSDEALQALAQIVTEVDVPAGQVLTRPYDPGLGMFIVEDGTVVVEQAEPAPSATKGSTGVPRGAKGPASSPVLGVPSMVPLVCYRRLLAPIARLGRHGGRSSLKEGGGTPLWQYLPVAARQSRQAEPVPSAPKSAPAVPRGVEGPSNGRVLGVPSVVPLGCYRRVFAPIARLGRRDL
jgi:hypothetical protein